MQMSACWYMCARVLNTSSVCQHARGWDVWQSKPENIVGRHNTRHLHVQHKGSKPRKIPACCVHVHISGRLSAPSFNHKPQYQQHFLTVTVFVWRAKERSQHQKKTRFYCPITILTAIFKVHFYKDERKDLMLLCPGESSPAATRRHHQWFWSYSRAECYFKARFFCFSVPKLGYLLTGYRFFSVKSQ